MRKAPSGAFFFSVYLHMAEKYLYFRGDATLANDDDAADGSLEVHSSHCSVR